MSAVLSEADPLGSGARSCGYRPEVVRSDIENTTSISMCLAGWRRFGTAPDFPGRKMKGVIAQTTGCLMKRKGVSRVSSGIERGQWSFGLPPLEMTGRWKG